MRFSSWFLAASSLFGLAAAGPPYQLRTDQDPVYHLYIQTYPEKNSSMAVLGPNTTSEYFNINGYIQSVNTTKYLNIGNETTSYKSLTFGTTATTTGWALEGDTIITSTTSPWGRQLNFLVCELDSTYWEIYFQTGSDTPTTGTCTDYMSLHLPCLC